MKFEKCLKDGMKFIQERNKSKYEQNHLDYVVVKYDDRVFGYLHKDGAITGISNADPTFRFDAFVKSELWDWHLF